jgi:preprotein translocase subunit SecB
MAKKENNTTAPEQEAQSSLIVNTQYIKDLSFENPSAPMQPLENEGSPDISIHIEAQAKPVVDRSFEVSLRIQVDAKRQEKKVFLLELEYAGVFTVGKDVPDEYLRPILMIECPRILFPFARHVVSKITQEAGYPALLLTPVDFAELYQRQISQEQHAQQEKEQTTGMIQ